MKGCSDQNTALGLWIVGFWDFPAVRICRFGSFRLVTSVFRAQRAVAFEGVEAFPLFSLCPSGSYVNEVFLTVGEWWRSRMTAFCSASVVEGRRRGIDAQLYFCWECFDFDNSISTSSIGILGYGSLDGPCHVSAGEWVSSMLLYNLWWDTKTTIHPVHCGHPTTVGSWKGFCKHCP